jgi:hypothetical protein
MKIISVVLDFVYADRHGEANGRIFDIFVAREPKVSRGINLKTQMQCAQTISSFKKVDYHILKYDTV